MNTRESKALKIQDKVYTTQLPPGERHFGEVIEINWHCVKIRWDDSQIGITDHRDMVEIHREVD